MAGHGDRIAVQPFSGNCCWVNCAMQQYLPAKEGLMIIIICTFDIEQKEQGIEYFEVLIRYIMNARNDIGIREIYELTKEISLERSEES